MEEKKEILVFCDNLSRYGVYRSYLETGVSNTSLRATTDEVRQHISKKHVDAIIIDIDIPSIKKKHLGLIGELNEKGIDVVLVLGVSEDITDAGLLACLDNYEVTILKEPFDYEILVEKFQLQTRIAREEETLEERAVCDLDSPFYDNEEQVCLEES